MQLIAPVTEREPVQRILPHSEPALSPARFPLEDQAFYGDQTTSDTAGQGERLFEPPPELPFNRTVSG